jgi:hypothetical protein
METSVDVDAATPITATHGPHDNKFTKGIQQVTMPAFMNIFMETGGTAGIQVSYDRPNNHQNGFVPKAIELSFFRAIIERLKDQLFLGPRFELDKNVSQTASAIAANISRGIKNQPGPSS